MGKELVAKVLENYRTAPINEKLRATLAFLEQATLAPDQASSAWAQAALAAGVSRQALTEALQVAFLFDVAVRLADTLGWEVLSPKGFQRHGRHLLKRGYI